MYIPASALLVLAGSTAVGIWFAQRRKITILPYQNGLFYNKGQLENVLAPGLYTVYRASQHIEIVDMRAQIIRVAAQEMLTSDNIVVKISQHLVMTVQDPAKAIHSSTDYSQHLQQQAQMILRSIVATMSLDDLLADRESSDGRLYSELTAYAQTLGLRIDAVNIKDIILPPGIKRACAGIVEAQKDAKRQLEKARGEQALLRSLANAARLYQEHPLLLNSRLIQSLGDGQNSVVFKAAPINHKIQNQGQNPQQGHTS